VSERVRSPQSAGAPDWQGMTKSEKRAAAKAERARAAAAKRRRQTILGVLAGLAVVGVIITAFVVFAGSDKSDGTAAGNQTSASAGPSTGATGGAFPQLPAGADPALGRKPTTTAGTGAVTKLVAKPLIAGNGPAAQSGQSITVNYVGVTYQTGQEFDASWKRSEPFTFQLGGGNVIKGWDQGLVGAKVGSRMQLDIPSELAYGDNPGGGRPGGPLRFIVDVLGVQ
jgi:peptidylprolyl isomerase